MIGVSSMIWSAALDSGRTISRLFFDLIAGNRQTVRPVASSIPISLCRSPEASALRAPTNINNRMT
jgi:hypothetical protein